LCSFFLFSSFFCSFWMMLRRYFFIPMSTSSFYNRTFSKTVFRLPRRSLFVVTVVFNFFILWVAPIWLGLFDMQLTMLFFVNYTYWITSGLNEKMKEICSCTASKC
jgi:hypothetical protein